MFSKRNLVQFIISSNGILQLLWISWHLRSKLFRTKSQGTFVNNELTPSESRTWLSSKTRSPNFFFEILFNDFWRCWLNWMLWKGFITSSDGKCSVIPDITTFWPILRRSDWSVIVIVVTRKQWWHFSWNNHWMRLNVFQSYYIFLIKCI